MQQGARMSVCAQVAVPLYEDVNSSLLKGSSVLRTVLKDLLYILEHLAYNFLCFGKVDTLNLDV